METLQLSNSQFDSRSPTSRIIMVAFGVAVGFLIFFSPGFSHLMVSLCILAAVACFIWLMILKSKVGYTLTSSHFQQHLFKGGWVVKWNNIESIGLCTYRHDDGWRQPLPWVGIRLKTYSPYLDSICLRVASDILLSQRALLYSGARQNHCTDTFEDMVLKSEHFTDQRGVKYKGLLAMLANRMELQRQFFGYDIYISVNDLDREAEDFIGLARRYLAAADVDLIKERQESGK